MVKVLDYGKLDLGCNPSFMRKNYFPKTSNRSLSQFPYKVDVFPLLKVLCLPKDIFDIFNEDTFPVSLQANMLCKVGHAHLTSAKFLRFWTPSLPLVSTKFTQPPFLLVRNWLTTPPPRADVICASPLTIRI